MRSTSNSVLRRRRWARPDIWAASLLGALVLGLLVLMLTQLEFRDRRPNGISNLKQLGLYLMMYRQENGDQLPPSIEAMWMKQLEHTDILVDPRDTDPVRRGREGWPQSYEYVGYLPPGMHRDAIICYSREDVYEYGRIVIHYDGHVTFIIEGDLHDPDQPVRKSLHASYWDLVEGIGDELTPERDAELRRFYEIEE